MRVYVLVTTIVGAAIGPAQAQPARAPLTAGTTAITHVAVIPLDRESVLPDRTVLIRDGRIVAIEPAGSFAVPRGARPIDGRGKYLIPGLADVHTHLYSDHEIPDSLGRYEVGVLLANGITAARLMIGTPGQLALRRSIEAGHVVGPHLWSASPQLTGRPDDNARVVTTPVQARAAVAEVQAAGYDFVKITNFIPDRATYDAIIDEARKRSIRVDGHVEPTIGVPHALRSGQNLQHLDGYLEAVLADSAPMRASVTQYDVFKLENWKSLDYLDDRKIGWIAGLTARSGVWVTPTLTIFNNAFAVPQSEEEIEARPEWALMPASLRTLYLRARAEYWSPAAMAVRTPARRARYIEVRNRIAKAISDSGGKILAGSDSPEWFFGYGWTLHRELQSLVTAGLTPYQALTAATRSPAVFLGASSEWGTIATGKRADLVILTANPLDDIRNTSAIAAVAIGGRWFEKPALDSMVAVAVQRITGGGQRSPAARGR
jgi:imidazolonepropionase-like amidohydrolase